MQLANDDKAGLLTTAKTAVVTAIGYLASIDFDFSLIDWTLAAGWFLGLFGVAYHDGKSNRAAQPDTNSPIHPEPTTIQTVNTAAAESAPISSSGFVFSPRSLSNLGEVHESLQKLASLALQRTPIDFVVIDGLRTAAEQKTLVEKGKSWTMDSQHLHGQAIDFAAIDPASGQITWDSRYFMPVVAVFKESAQLLGLKIACGSDWSQRDYGHIELKRGFYT